MNRVAWKLDPGWQLLREAEVRTFSAAAPVGDKTVARLARSHRGVWKKERIVAVRALLVGMTPQIRLSSLSARLEVDAGIMLE